MPGRHYNAWTSAIFGHTLAVLVWAHFRLGPRPKNIASAVLRPRVLPIRRVRV